MRYQYVWKDSDYELFIPLHEVEERDEEMVNTVAASAMDAIGLFDALGMDHAKALVLFLELLCEMDRTTGHIIRPSAQEMVDAIAAYRANPFPLPKASPFPGVFVTITKKQWVRELVHDMPMPAARRSDPVVEVIRSIPKQCHPAPRVGRRALTLKPKWA